VPIIRRNSCVYATLGICYSVWVTVLVYSLHIHNCFSWRWAHIFSKHVEIDKYTKNKYTKNILCTKLALFTRLYRDTVQTKPKIFWDIMLPIYVNGHWCFLGTSFLLFWLLHTSGYLKFCFGKGHCFSHLECEANSLIQLPIFRKSLLPPLQKVGQCPALKIPRRQVTPRRLYQSTEVHGHVASLNILILIRLL
jgi:hypothetical protein